MCQRHFQEYELGSHSHIVSRWYWRLMILAHKDKCIRTLSQFCSYDHLPVQYFHQLLRHLRASKLSSRQTDGSSFVLLEQIIPSMEQLITTALRSSHTATRQTFLNSLPSRLEVEKVSPDRILTYIHHPSVQAVTLKRSDR